MKIHIGIVNCTLLTILFVFFKAVDKCQHHVCNQGVIILNSNYFLFSSIQILCNIYCILAPVDKCQHHVCHQSDIIEFKFSSIQIQYNTNAIWGLVESFSQSYLGL